MGHIAAATHAREYIAQVAEGQIPSSRCLMGWAREAHAASSTWAWEAIDPYEECVSHLSQATGSRAGQPLVLLPWQWAVAAQLLCDPHCKALLVAVARGAGKTELAASLLAYKILANGSHQQYFAIAPTLRAASIVFDRLRTMLRQLDPEAQCSDGVAISQQGGWIRAQGSVMRALPCTETAMDGIAARLIVADEVARMERGFARVVTGLAKDAASQLLCITTPDERQRTRPVWPYWQQLAGHYVGEGAAPEGWRAMLYGLDADDDAMESEHWVKAQPSLDHTVSRGSMRGSIEAMLGTHDPEQVAECDMQILCRHNDRLAGAVDLGLLDRAMGADIQWDALKGSPAVVAIDLARGAVRSETANLSSAALAVWDAPHERVCIQMLHWWAGQDIEVAERRSRQPLRRWEAEGLLRRMPGETHDMGIIEAAIMHWMALYSVRQVGVDPLSHQESALADWRKRRIPVIAVEQGIRTMGPAWALWTDGLRSQRVVHAPDDCLRYCLSATRTIEDNAGNVRPVKGRSAANIDAVVASCMAMVLVERYQVSKRSSYEQGRIVL